MKNHQQKIWGGLALLLLPITACSPYVQESAPASSGSIASSGTTQALPDIQKVTSIQDLDRSIMELTDQEVAQHYVVLCELSTYPSRSDIASLTDLTQDQKLEAIEAINQAPEVIRYLGYQSVRPHLGESAATSPNPQVPDRCYENGRQPSSLNPSTSPNNKPSTPAGA